MAFGRNSRNSLLDGAQHSSVKTRIKYRPGSCLADQGVNFSMIVTCDHNDIFDFALLEQADHLFNHCMVTEFLKGLILVHPAGQSCRWDHGGYMARRNFHC